MMARANSREGKRALLYDGHDRRAGDGAKKKAMKARHRRRNLNRSLRDMVQSKHDVN